MDLVGKTLCDETGEEYVVLKLINYKAIKCAYAVSVNSDEKRYFKFLEMDLYQLIVRK